MALGGKRRADGRGGRPSRWRSFTGLDGLKKALLNRPELFVTTATEKMMTYSLGRGTEPFDAPAIRRIVQDSRSGDYKFSSLVLGIVEQRSVSDEEVAIMIVTKKALPRRTFLRGMGAALSLPLLDAMIPALTAAPAAGRAREAPGLRLHPDGQ